MKKNVQNITFQLGLSLALLAAAPIFGVGGRVQGAYISSQFSTSEARLSAFEEPADRDAPWKDIKFERFAQNPKPPCTTGDAESIHAGFVEKYQQLEPIKDLPRQDQLCWLGSAKPARTANPGDNLLGPNNLHDGAEDREPVPDQRDDSPSKNAPQPNSSRGGDRAGTQSGHSFSMQQVGIISHIEVPRSTVIARLFVKNAVKPTAPDYAGLFRPPRSKDFCL